MDLVKEYIVQTISTAANSLRLSSEKIEVVSMLKEVISNSENLEEDLKKMKKITELSTIGIRLHRTYSAITEEKIDFARLSETFKDHSKWLVNDLSHLLDMVTPVSFKEVIDKMLGKEKPEPVKPPEVEDEEISIDLSKRDSKEQNFDFEKKEESAEEIPVEKDLENKTEPKIDKKETGVKNQVEKTEEKQTNLSFEDKILKTVNSIDPFLEIIASKKYTSPDIEPYLLRLEQNQKLSLDHNLYIVAHMHAILFDCLSFIKGNPRSVNEEIVESMRGCLIVIAAIVRRKEVDISNYLNKAEVLGANIRKIKGKELSK